MSKISQIYTTKQLRAKLRHKKWIMEYNQLFGIVDNSTGKVMYIEQYGPLNGFFIEGWRAHHFPHTSSIVEKSYREGGSTIFILKQGKAKLKLVPAFSPIGIEECTVIGKDVHITIAGLGGGGVSASFSRGLAKGVKKVEVIESGGGTKPGKGRITLPKSKLVLIGIDDTDNLEEGATFSLAHNIALDIAKMYGVYYAIHNNVQLFPNNPHKTKNCMGTVIGFIFESNSSRSKIISEFKKQLRKYSVSNETGMAVMDGFNIPKKLQEYSLKAKNSFIDKVDEPLNIAKHLGIDTFAVTGSKGLIGAVASLGYFDNPELAASLPGKIIDDHND